VRQASSSSDPNDVRVLLNRANCDILNYLVDTADPTASTAGAAPTSATATELRPARTLLHALHVFIFVASREAPAWTPLSNILSSRLQDALGNLSSQLGEWAASRTPALLWALAVGAATSPERSERREWFVSRLEVIAEMMHLRTRIELESLLRTFLWHEGTLGRFVREWWDETRWRKAVLTPSEQGSVGGQGLGWGFGGEVLAELDSGYGCSPVTVLND
jgi:hypothetical protein